MSGRPTREQVRAWADEVGVVGERIGRHFARSEPRRRAVGYVRGLLSGTARKNGWQLAEHLGDATPDGVQHLLARADWDADAVRNDLIDYAREHVGHPDGVLVVDETGFLKKGTKSCGVARQYSGTAGRIENSQIGEVLGHAAATSGRPPARGTHTARGTGGACAAFGPIVANSLQFALRARATATYFSALQVPRSGVQLPSKSNEGRPVVGLCGCDRVRTPLTRRGAVVASALVPTRCALHRWYGASASSLP
jgi:hypothetical protein